ncbi:MAG TPA: MurT ligase domain-containing protein [Motilibacteraceae bacterium]|nr:MurT ligase domain-containing protein [Motilibacteraceae bacterium]
MPAARNRSRTGLSAPAASRPRLGLRGSAAVGAGVLAGRLTPLLRLGRGSTVGGRVALTLDPQLLDRLAAGREVVIVSGTNGKSTTTRLVGEALSVDGPVASNRTGANMTEGIVLALARERAAGRAVLEVDESYVPSVAARTHPKVIALLNLSRDQLDRVAEVRKVADRWRQGMAQLSPDCTVVANADDPLVVWAAETAPHVVWVAAGRGWVQDAPLCPWCASLLAVEDGAWRCTGCEHRRPDPELSDVDGRAVSTAGGSWPLRTALPGRANRSNALVALGVALASGVDGDRASAAIAAVGSVDGRYERRRHGQHVARMLLSKNPAGWSELFTMLEPAVPVVVAVNAEIADGLDTSWLWDVQFELLAGRQVAVTGARRADVAVRLTVAGVPHTVAPDLAGALAALPPGPVDVAANYTAMRDVRQALAGCPVVPEPVRVPSEPAGGAA